MRYEDYEEAYDDEDLRSDCDDHEIFWWRVCKVRQEWSKYDEGEDYLLTDLEWYDKYKKEVLDELMEEERASEDAEDRYCTRGLC